MAEPIEIDVLVVGASGAGIRAAYEAPPARAKILPESRGKFGLTLVEVAFNERGVYYGR